MASVIEQEMINSDVIELAHGMSHLEKPTPIEELPDRDRLIAEIVGFYAMQNRQCRRAELILDRIGVDPEADNWVDEISEGRISNKVILGPDISEKKTDMPMANSVAATIVVVTDLKPVSCYRKLEQGAADYIASPARNFGVTFTSEDANTGRSKHLWRYMCYAVNDHLDQIREASDEELINRYSETEIPGEMKDLESITRTLDLMVAYKELGELREQTRLHPVR